MTYSISYSSPRSNLVAIRLRLSSLIKRISFCGPPKSDIVIYGKDSTQIIEKHILKELPFTVFSPEKLSINLNFGFFRFFIKAIFLLNEKSRQELPALGNGLKYRVYSAYLLASILQYEPKIVITPFDNVPSYQWLARAMKGSQFFAIQNGNRTEFEHKRFGKRQTYHQHLFCFGKYDADIFEERGDIVEHCYEVGSLRASVYKERNSLDSGIYYDICIVSTFFLNTTKEEEFNKMEKAILISDQFFAKYIKKHNLKAVVATKGYEGEDEQVKYFKSIYGGDIEIEERGAYFAIDRSEIVVGFMSTAVREAFGWGKKVLHLDFSGVGLCEFDSAILIKKNDFDFFEKRLNAIRFTSSDEYKIKTKEYADYLMKYNPETPTHRVIRKKVIEYL
jgi:surface carbohydrate biosynthesis protein